MSTTKPAHNPDMVGDASSHDLALDGRDAEPQGWGVHGWLVILLCGLAYLLSTTDRQIISLLIQPIEHDLHLSDTQFGLLQGLVFSMLYATMGLPIARLADRRSRTTIITIGVAVWSIATMFCGLARSFVQLGLARAVVGTGEAALSPAAYSLIGDVLPRRALGRATALYSLGTFLGTTVAFLAGGLLLKRLGADGTHLVLGFALQSWQLVFLLVGAPGVLLALVIGLTLHDKARRPNARPAPETQDRMLPFLRRNAKVFGPYMVGYPLYAMALYVLLGWATAYLVRVHGFTTAAAGLWLGPVSLVACGIGVLLSGFLTDFGTRKGRQEAFFAVGGGAALALTVTMAALPFVSGGAALWLLGAALFFSSFPMAPSIALLQTHVPSALRAQVSALLLFMNNLIGFALGNFLVGWLNDHMFTAKNGVGLSLPLVVAVGGFLAALTLARGAIAIRGWTPRGPR